MPYAPRKIQAPASVPQAASATPIPVPQPANNFMTAPDPWNWQWSGGDLGYMQRVNPIGTPQPVLGGELPSMGGAPRNLYDTSQISGQPTAGYNPNTYDWNALIKKLVSFGSDKAAQKAWIATLPWEVQADLNTPRYMIG